MQPRIKQDTKIALKKASTLLGKVQDMVEEDAYCIDIMQQLLAVRGLIKSANFKMMENHLGSCFKSAMQSKDAKLQEKMIKEILQVQRLGQK